MYKKAMSCLLLANLLFVFGFMCIKGVAENRTAAATAFEVKLDETYVADNESSAMGIVSVAASGQRVVDCNVLEKKLAYQLSEEEVNVLLRIVEAEAGGEDIEGKLLVANVVLNRVNSSKFPNTVKEVVFQQEKGVTQFSPVANGRYYTVEISDETVEAVALALMGEDISQGALYFAAREYADDDRMRWFDENLTLLFKHGGHEFFK
ncbi:MAG: cell wall hydrolase [Lachnospiraceae bacterium]|nr:cell wall hydrolase [Lachnospiraceae bacterium]